MPRDDSADSTSIAQQLCPELNIAPVIRMQCQPSQTKGNKGMLTIYELSNGVVQIRIGAHVRWILATELRPHPHYQSSIASRT